VDEVFDSIFKAVKVTFCGVVATTKVVPAGCSVIPVSVAPTTVTLTFADMTPAHDAVTVAVPVDVPVVTRPSSLTVAVAGVVEVQVAIAVRSYVVPSE
jgi:hypothetical protein